MELIVLSFSLYVISYVGMVIFTCSSLVCLRFILDSFLGYLFTSCAWRMTGLGLMESSKETGCQVPEGPILCINNCGFFGSTATMNMCSKCHKDTVLKQQAKLAASSIEDIVNSSSSSTKNEPYVAEAANAKSEFKVVSPQPSSELGTGLGSDTKAQEGPNRCATCRKRVGLTGFSCRCGHMFCSLHRYSDKHNCQFDYRNAAQDAIAKANPVVKAEKLDKI